MKSLHPAFKKKKLIIWSFVVLFLISGSLISCLSRLPSIWKPDYHLLYKDNLQPVKVGFTCSREEPDDATLYKMIDDVIYQVYGEKGLRAIIKKGDKVVLKINLATSAYGIHGQKGRGCITDPRIVRYIAEKVREIIGWEKPASIIVTDSLFHEDPHPSGSKGELTFQKARLERHGYDPIDRVDPKDFCLDYNDDCILDGTSGAELVNIDSIGMDRRFLTLIQEPTLGETEVYLPNILRTKEQANGDQEYCDVLIGLPVLKSHLSEGLTGALKLHYGFRHRLPSGREQGRSGHSGFSQTGNLHLLSEYICAQHKVRTYDFILMDAITGNRRGPHNLCFASDINNSTDYILINTLLASTDPVAMDTVASLLAGYKPESVSLIGDAAVNGLGICWPEWIRLEGLDALNKHRQYLMAKYNPEKMREKYKKVIDTSPYNWRGFAFYPVMLDAKIGVFGSYPFAEWGPARNLENFDYNAFDNASLQISKETNNRYLWKYVSSEGRKEKEVARVDFLINGNPIGFRVKSKWDDVWETDLSGYHGNVTCQLAAWDYRLNCTLSEVVTVQLP